MRSSRRIAVALALLPPVARGDGPRRPEIRELGTIDLDMTYLEARPGPRYETHIVRSRDLIRWDSSPFNPCSATSTTSESPTRG
jgi:hypothetical protein